MLVSPLMEMRLSPVFVLGAQLIGLVQMVIQTSPPPPMLHST